MWQRMTRLQHTRRYLYDRAPALLFFAVGHFFRGFCLADHHEDSHRTFDSEGEALNVFPLARVLILQNARTCQSISKEY